MGEWLESSTNAALWQEHSADAEITRLTCSDVTDGKKSDTNVSVDVPLLGFTVRLTTVVHEPWKITFRTRVDDAKMFTYNNNYE